LPRVDALSVALFLVDTDVLTIHYPDLFTLLAHLQGMGENNCIIQRANAVSRDTFLAAAAAYEVRKKKKNRIKYSRIQVVFFFSVVIKFTKFILFCNFFFFSSFSLFILMILIYYHVLFKFFI
jgi:hypothetical protein